MPTPPELRDAIRAATEQLAAAGVASPRHDAEELAAFALGTTRNGLHRGVEQPALIAWRAAYPALLARRAAREPLQHITGVAYFRHLALAVGPGVFVPRPETELLVELALPLAGPGRTVIDLCAGSGAVGLAIASERPGTIVRFVEADPVAARWLRRNVESVALDPPPAVHVGAVRDALPDLADADVVLANPPYLPVAAGDQLEPEVAGFDPPAALWGGADGLDVLREVVLAAGRLLRPGGLLAVEHDARHQPEVLDLCRQHGFADVTGHLDLTSTARFVTGLRR